MGRERAGHSLQPTALIHEAYLRLVGSAPVDWRDRGHFYALSARLMRQILVDHARSRGRRKRGGGAMPIAFDETVIGPRETPDLVRLDDALHALAETDARKSRVIELRFFGGFSVDEVGGRPRGLAADGAARLAAGEGVAATGNETGRSCPTLSAGPSSSGSITRPLTRPVADRPAFLESACAGDATLRHEVESLLANDEASLLEKSALDVAARAMAQQDTPSWVGRTIRNYDILSLVGVGGMGEVYRARDRSLGREVALKVLPHEVSKDPERVKRLEREARTLASLNHPAVATLFGLEEHEGQRFLVMELVPGQTLAERLRHGPLPIRDALDVCRQIAEGLEAAHDAGIVHRDLKPANVKVTPDGRVKLLDFGLAKALDTAPSGVEPTVAAVEATREGTVLGTPAYMSPEQARGQLVDRRADIWAFGCCLYECLSGRRPFKGDTVTDTLAAVLDKEPDWGALGDHVPRRCHPAASTLSRERRPTTPSAHWRCAAGPRGNGS